MSSTPYFSSRQRSTYTHPAIHATSAANGNKGEMRRSLNQLDNRLSQVETRVGGGSINLKTSSPIASPPPQAQFGVGAKAGVFRIQITNPQFAGKGNDPHTPIQHRVTFSSTADFRSSETYPVGNQTYYEVSKYPVGARKWIRIDSSYDGHTYNQAKVIGPLTA